MNNLTTRKIILGLLMAVVLAFGVQGIADALTLNPSTSPGNHSTLIMGGTITLNGIRGTLNDAGMAESVEITTAATIEDYPSGGWMEQLTTTVPDLTAGNGTITIPSSVKITFPSAGTVTVTVTWTPKVNADPGSEVFTFYVVPDSSPTAGTLSFDEPPTSPENLGYHSARITEQISPANDGLLNTATADLPLRYSVSGGTLYVADGSTNGRTISSSQTISSSAPVWLRTNGRTSVVSVYVEGQNAQRQAARVTVIHRYPQISRVSGHSPKQAGSPGSRLRHPFVVHVTDAGGRNVPGQEVTFISGNSGAFSAHPDFPNAVTSPVTPLSGSPQTTIGTNFAVVTTDSQGRASVHLVLGTATVEYTVTAQFPTGTVVGDVTLTDTFKVEFKADALDEAVASTIEKVAETDGQTADAFGRVEKPLTVVVRDQGGNPIEDARVTFNDRSGGTLSSFPTDPGDLAADVTGNGTNPRTRLVDTDASGEASIRYKAREGGARHTVDASITTGGYQEVSFTVNGTPSSGGGGGGDVDDDVDEDVDDITNTITVRPLSLSGAPGAVVPLGLGPITTNFTVTGNAAFTAAGGLVSETGAIRDVRLPNAAGTAYALTVSATDYTSVTVPVTVTGTASTGLGTLTVSKDGAQIGTQQQVLVSASPAPSSNLVFTVTSSGFRVGSGEITTAGTGKAIINVPTASGLYTLTVSATGYDPQQVTFTAGAQTPLSTTTPPATAGEPSSVQISGDVVQTGTVNEQLDLPLAVRVLDANGRGVSDTRVVFRVDSGQGRLSQRGNGRAVQVQTDRSGYARASYTPMSASSTVRAKATGVAQTVTFTITTDGAAVDEAPAEISEPRSATVSPVVHIGAASRPPMLWVDGGAIYALVGASPQRFASSVDNALNITVAGGKVYWTEKTGESGGTINSANLNGSGVKELASIFATPMGIAVDTAGSKLYWTNSAGRIQSADLDGSGITNVLQNLPGPKDIAVARGNVYWTQFDATAGAGNVGIVNPTAAQRIARYISTGSDIPGSVVIGGGKVYWTETTGESGGTVNSANLNGTGATPLASIQAVPIGIAVDGSRSKLYWSNSRGRIQSANLDGSGIKNVVDGLGSPGDMVLSNSITAPAGAGSSARSGTTASDSKYDVNGDGVVDGKDKVLVLDAVVTGTYVAKYDVNDDKKVNILDYVLVEVNIDGGAAGAPALLGMKLSAIQIDRLQEQIDLLIATNDRSPAALRTLIYLQQLLVTARPEKTQLLANYPNPFNPETWIPYELATDTHVRITIYNTQGVVIRTLQLGHQSGGYYTGRDRAAYWDGRNALGEQVASGLYFYQLETDEMSLMRKMVILK